MFAFDAIRNPALVGPRAAHFHRQVEQQGQIRTQAIGSPAFKIGDAFPGLPAAAALVGVAGVGEAVGQYPVTTLECRTDQFAHELRARREHQQEFAFGADILHRSIEHQAADRLAERGAARLPGYPQDDSARLDVGAQVSEDGALARAFATFQRDQAAAHGFLRLAR